MKIETKHLRGAAWIIYQEEEIKKRTLFRLLHSLIEEAKALKRGEIEQKRRNKKAVDKS